MDVCLIFTFHDDAGDDTLVLKGELFKYLIKVRRHKKNDILAFRNKKNVDTLYSYSLDDIDSRKAILTLKSSEKYIVSADKKLHIGWCIIDPKSI